MISVAMTTYNGSNYIIQQLDSLRNQSIHIDEVIICDDFSSDDTVSILLEYKEKWKLNNWKVIQNKKNIGWKRNFYNAIKLTKGDIIFFADQDDIWDIKKVEIMSKKLLCSEFDVLCCTASFINGKGEKLYVDSNVLPYGATGEKVIYKNNITNKFIYTIMPGCTMAVKRSFIERVAFVFDNEKIISTLPHDALFWKIATLNNKAAILNRNLIMYRIHTYNASSPQVKANYKTKSKRKRMEEINSNKEQLLAIKSIYEKMGGVDNIKFLEYLISFCQWREDFVNKKRFIELLGYYKYYRNIRMLLGDVAVIILKNRGS